MRLPEGQNRLLLVHGLRLRYQERPYQDGTRFIDLQCCEKDCQNRCAMCFSTPSALWNVPAERLAEKLCSLCVELAKEVERTVSQDGQQIQGSLVKGAKR